MKIRKAALKDLNLIVKINRDSQDPLDKIIGITDQDMKNMCSNLLKYKKAEFYVYKNIALACFKQDFVGYKNCELFLLLVSKKYQNKGIGTKLLKFIENHAKKRKFRAIYIYTHPIHTVAIRLYRKNGYKKINEFPNYYSNGDKSLLFGKKLK